VGGVVQRLEGGVGKERPAVAALWPVNFLSQLPPDYDSIKLQPLRTAFPTA
jgi:hypothetical protein